ncbi:MAG: sugar nucleotide-binding protein, partial [Christiangramia sp.]|nr:sugar nucleotide-binding protein [Christiangramia sp.]
MKTILVTGANGQLGKCIQKHSKKYPSYKFLFCSSRELDITHQTSLDNIFSEHEVDYCINSAAYTNVEQAENEKKKAYLVNAEGARNVAEACKEHNATLIHISTDYVFNGQAQEPYKETDEVDPIN